MAVTTISKVHFVFLDDFPGKTLFLDIGTETDPIQTPLSNLQKNGRRNIAGITLHPTNNNLKITAGDGGTEYTAGGVGIVRHNFTPSAIINIKFFEQDGTTLILETNPLGLPTGDIDAWGSPLVWGGTGPASSILVWGGDPSVTEGLPLAYTVWFDELLYYFMVIEIEDQATVNAEIGKIVVGESFEAGVNAKWGRTLEWTKESAQIRTAGGTLRTEEFPSERKFDLIFEELSDTESTELSRQLLLSGESGEILLALNPGDDNIRAINEQTALVKRVTSNKTARNFFNINAIPLSFEEA